MKKKGRRRSSPLTPPQAGALVARVLTDVAGIDKEFDYLVPAHLTATVSLGAQVRVELHGRRVGAWITELGVDPPPGVDLREIAAVRGWGPEPEIIDLAGWAAHTWAGRRGAFLTAASAVGAVGRLPAPMLRPPAPPATMGYDKPGAGEPELLRLPPASDVTPVVAALAQLGPTLVVLPSVSRAAVLAGRLRRAGGDVALLPDDWAQARAGAAVVVGSRGAAWGPCPGLAAAIVVDGHDEGLGQEGAPTWHAVAVAVERARRAGAAVQIVSAMPTPELLSLAEPVLVPRSAEREGWAAVEVLDRRGDDPRLGLYSQRLARLVSDAPRVICVLNRTGRARLLACASCGDLVHCERCAAALAQRADDPGVLTCPKCELERPAVCSNCFSTVMRHLKVGVSRAREELEAISGRPVGEVTASTKELPEADVLIGTEAVLHRVTPADGYKTVAFVDFDQELTAPRVRAASEALALLALASRLVGGRSGRVAIQTRQPGHPVIQAALLADPKILSDWEIPLRRELRLPPFSAVALVSGEAAGEYTERLLEQPVEVLGPSDGEWLVKAADRDTLAGALAAVPRPAGRLRVAVDPARF